jgi:uncharacterized membrane protein (UPF0136 family)
MFKTGIVLGLLLAVVSAVGGILGYTQAGSTPSLIAGVASGILLAVGGIGALRGKLGFHILMVVVALALLARFLPVYFQAPKVWPALVMIALSAGTFGFGLIGIVLDRFRPGSTAAAGK